MGEGKHLHGEFLPLGPRIFPYHGGQVINHIRQMHLLLFNHGGSAFNAAHIQHVIDQ